MFSNILYYINKLTYNLEKVIKSLEMPEWIGFVLLLLIITVPFYIVVYGIPFFLSNKRRKRKQVERAQKKEEIYKAERDRRLKEMIESHERSVRTMQRRVNKEARIREQKLKIISEGNFVKHNDFEKQWIFSTFSVVDERFGLDSNGTQSVSFKVHEEENKRGDGLKYRDRPGCYVILIFDEAVTDSDFSNYKEVYVGQSINMYQRVHNHFTGKGNGDVYADVKYGKHVYVKFFPCDEGDLNSKEKDLIELFNATKSYNKTSGGSAGR